MSDELTQEMRGAVLLVTIDRPKARNALTWDLILELGEAFRAAGADDAVRCIVLTGAGGHFCAGGDVKDQAARREWEIGDFVAPGRRLGEAIESVYRCPKPTIAALSGAVAGAGVSVALTCDVRVADATARFGFAYGAIGLSPDFGLTWTLPRAIGRGRAARLLYTSARIDADEALDLGLVDELLGEGTALDGALALADEIAAAAPLGVGFVKAGLLRADEMPYGQAVAAEATAMHIARRTEDHAEGLAALREKRPPRFRGR